MAVYGQHSETVILPDITFEEFVSKASTTLSGSSKTRFLSLIDKCERYDGPDIIKKLSLILGSHPILFDDFTTLLTGDVQAFPSSNNACTEIDIVTIIQHSKVYAEIFPVSAAARQDVSYISNTDDLRRLMGRTEEPWKAIVGISPRWVAPVIELLQLELDHNVEDNPYRRNCFRCLRHLVLTFETLPRSLSALNVTKESINIVAGGGQADIFMGRMNGAVVCLKMPRIHITSIKTFYHEALLWSLVWKQVHHPNVLPFLGATTTIPGYGLVLISPWMQNGDIMSFLVRHPEHNKFEAVAQIAEGIKYLHGLDPPIIHADIKGENVLVKDNLACCLSDFGIAVIHETHTLASESVPIKGSERWMAPEIISAQGFGLSVMNTPARDIYAFACTILQIFTGKAPFCNVKYNVQVINSVIAGLRPERPRDSEDYIEDLWTLTQQCWHQDPSLRPSAGEVAKALAALASEHKPRPRPKPKVYAAGPYHHRRLAHTFRLRVGNAAELRAYLLSSDAPWEGFESLDDCYVGPAIEFLQMELDRVQHDEIYRRKCIRSIQALLRRDPDLPMSFKVPDIQPFGSYPVYGSSFADIWKGIQPSSGHIMRLKVLRLFTKPDRSIHFKMCTQEAFIWRQLHHPNICKFIGINMSLFAPSPCLVTPWIENGNVVHHMRRCPNHDKLAMILDISKGMEYLHGLNILHGDIRGANVLVDNEGRCLLANFVFSRFMDVESYTQSTNLGGLATVRWMAPEVIEASSSPTTTSLALGLPQDVFAFACTVLEMYTGAVPFREIQHDLAVATALCNGKRPERPRDILIPDAVWQCIVICWKQQPETRPEAEKIVKILDGLKLLRDES